MATISLEGECSRGSHHGPHPGRVQGETLLSKLNEGNIFLALIVFRLGVINKC